jgi:hypothetical protein
MACDSGLPGKKKSTRILWAELLKRIFGINVLRCSRCKIRTNIVGVVRDPQTILVRLTATGLSKSPPPVAPFRRTGLWANARKFDKGIDTTFDEVSERDCNSTNHHNYIDGDFRPDP